MRDPELSRLAGRIVGTRQVTLSERHQINTALDNAKSWEEVPAETRRLLEEIAHRPPVVGLGQQTATTEGTRAIAAAYERHPGHTPQAVHGNWAKKLPRAPKPPAKKATAKKAKPRKAPGRIDWAARIASGELSSTRLGDGENRNHVYLVEFGDGSRAVSKYSTAGFDAAQDEFAAEELGAKVAEAMGLRPPAVHRDGDHAAFFSHVHDADPKAVVGAEYGDWNVDVESKAAKRIGLLDVLIENSDRNPGNWFVADPAASELDLIPIDHGYAWEETDRIAADKIRTPNLFEHYLLEEVPIEELPEGYRAEDIYRFGDNDLSPQYLRQLRARFEPLRADFETAGRVEWFDRLMTRLDIVAEHAKGTVTL